MGNSPAPVDVRVRESAQARELHVTACPRPGAAPQEQAKAMFSGIGDVLRGHGARIIQERILAAPDLMDMLASARAGAYAGLDDGVPPSWLVVPPGLAGPIAGAQVHAVAGCPAPEVLRLEGAARGRVVQAGSLRYVIGSNLSADEPAEPSRQAQSMLAKAERLLSLAGGSLFNVARTWMWLGDILEWYADFNRVRNRFFTERGLLNNNGNGRLPASIGIGPAGKFKCSMDLCGVIGIGHAIEYLLAGGNQGPASEYGSAFSRAAAASAKTISAHFDLGSVPRCYRTAEALADKYDINLAIHNHGGQDWLGSPAMISHVLKNTSERIGLCLDTAWMLDTGADPVRAAETFAQRLYGLHIKDFTFDSARRPQDVVVGTGNLDLKALFEVIRAKAPKGICAVLEYEGDEHNPVPALRQCANAVRKVESK